jgi:hypothetical protein
MHLPPPFVYPQSTNEPPALVRVMDRREVMWNRPTFKAPPLQIDPPVGDVAQLTAALRKAEFLAR